MLSESRSSVKLAARSSNYGRAAKKRGGGGIVSGVAGGIGAGLGAVAGGIGAGVVAVGSGVGSLFSKIGSAFSRSNGDQYEVKAAKMMTKSKSKKQSEKSNVFAVEKSEPEPMI